MVPVIYCQTDSVISERTLKSQRKTFYENLINNTIVNSLKTELNPENESKWKGAFWAMELSGYKSDLTYNSVKNALENFENCSPGFQRALLEVIYTLYQNEFMKEVEGIYKTTDNEKIFAMAANYLYSSSEYEFILEKFIKELRRFLNWENHPILYSMFMHFNEENSKGIDLNKVLSIKLVSKVPIVFCLQRRSRDYEGLIIIRKSDGSFLKNDDGSIFSVPALARSVTNLPYYLTNGNSPQGFYSIQKISSSSNVFIGPTNTIEMGMPFEIPLNKFFHDDNLKDEWNLENYSSFIPKEFRDNDDFYESFYAGKAGRTEIIIHGTTINPEFYKNKVYYPNTPSLGCITLSELWNEKSGKRGISRQAELIKAAKKIKLAGSYLLLIEIDDKNESIKIDEISNYIHSE